jgi:hypothetical protein
MVMSHKKLSANLITCQLAGTRWPQCCKHSSVPTVMLSRIYEPCQKTKLPMDKDTYLGLQSYNLLNTEATKSSSYNVRRKTEVWKAKSTAIHK